MAKKRIKMPIHYHGTTSCNRPKKENPEPKDADKPERTKGDPSAEE